MERHIQYKGQRLYYMVSGQGNPVMFIHGFAEDHTIWKYQIPEFQEKCLLIVPDLPGSGKSKGWGVMTIESLAEAVKAILDAEKIDTITLIGHSMGGYITLAFAEKYPAMLKSFCLFHSTAYPDTEEKKATRRKSIAFIKKHGTHEFLKQSIPNNFGPVFKETYSERIHQLIEQYRDFSPDSLVAYYEAMIERPDRTTVLKEFKQPILFILGRQDNAVPLQDGLQQCHLPVFAYIHILDDSGHMGLWEEYAESNEILSDFLAGK